MISINFVGDIALFNVFQEKGIDPFKDVYLPESDYNIGNFEFIIPNNRKKNFFDVSDKYKVDFEYFKGLNLNRFDAFSLANNHCLDYGVQGVNDVINVLNEKKVQSFGFGKKNYNLLTFSLKEVSFAIIGFVKQGRWSRNINQIQGPDNYNLDEIVTEIKRLKQTYHHVLVFPHWGTELVDVPEPKDVENARLFIDSGATAVIGHHPHIVQGIDKYKKGVIAFSLGSFIYVPEMENGYKSNQNKNRDFSLCLNLTFDKERLITYNEHYYKYEANQLLSVPIKKEKIINYLTLINDKIGDRAFYKKRIREVLLKREFIAFLTRLKDSPIKTIKHYSSYIKISHLKKVFFK